ncbi:DUF418 domain-containing protein [Spirosoma koreense]
MFHHSGGLVSFYNSSILLLAIVYRIELSLFSLNQTRFARRVSHAGRMELSNHLVHTPLCMLLFCGHALGLSGQLTFPESSR